MPDRTFGRRTGFVPPEKPAVLQQSPVAAPRQSTAWIDAVGPLLIGLAGFLIVVGHPVLDPRNIAWLAHGDAGTHYLGWVFFRATEWLNPLGANPRYGIELASSVVYSDSNPLLALLFKPFAPWLPEPFQYFGLWLLVCFLGQAWFGWRLVGLWSDSRIVRAFGAGLFVFSPPMLWRAQTHVNLASQFLVLAALLVVLDREMARKWLFWALLITIAVLVHAYILAMVVALWAADLVIRAIEEKTNPRWMALEIVSVLALVWVAALQAGYFAAGTAYVASAVSGYGDFRANLLTFFDPSGWSYVLGDLPEQPLDYEGFNYLGAGLLFLLICAVPALLAGRLGVGRLLRRFWVLALVLLMLTAFAVTNRVGVGLVTFEIPLPDSVVSRLQTLRASGRLLWPVFYVMAICAIAAVSVGYGRRMATLLLAVALALQVVDTSAGWRPIRTLLTVTPSQTWPTPLKSPFWEAAALRYAKVRIIPPANPARDWLVFAAYAAQYGLATDAVYLARVSDLALLGLIEDDVAAIVGGAYAPDTLYILDEPSARAAQASLDDTRDLLARIDGFLVIAPGWKTCTDCPSVPDGIEVGQ